MITLAFSGSINPVPGLNSASRYFFFTHQRSISHLLHSQISRVLPEKADFVFRRVRRESPQHILPLESTLLGHGLQLLNNVMLFFLDLAHLLFLLASFRLSIAVDMRLGIWASKGPRPEGQLMPFDMGIVDRFSLGVR